jgi:hypothetical protein
LAVGIQAHWPRPVEGKLHAREAKRFFSNGFPL